MFQKKLCLKRLALPPERKFKILAVTNDAIMTLLVSNKKATLLSCNPYKADRIIVTGAVTVRGEALI